MNTTIIIIKGFLSNCLHKKGGMDCKASITNDKYTDSPHNLTGHVLALLISHTYSIRQLNYSVQNTNGCVCPCTFAWKASHANLSDNRVQNPTHRWLSCSAACAMSSARLPSGGEDIKSGLSHTLIYPS